LVAWIRQVPEVVAVMVLEAVLFARAQLVALPPETIAYVVAPSPLPPDGVSVTAWLYGEVLLETLIVKERVAWAALLTVKVTALDVTAVLVAPFLVFVTFTRY
jgi:hypothetical protein